MKTKRLKLVLTVSALALLLTGCSSNGDLIDLSTKFSAVKDDGFFSAIITYPLAQAINYLEPITGIFLAITLVTVAINVILLAFTFKSSVAMQRMQEIQPELQKIQAKYEGRTDNASQQRMAMEMQQIYAKYNVNPLGALATTFLQFPLLVGMYSAVRRSSAVANASFMNVSLALTPSDALKQKAWVCVVIFVLMVICQFVSIKVPMWMAEAKGKKEADAHHKSYKKPEQQNQMMTYMMLGMVALAMYSCPTALSLYYLIYSVINVVKTLAISAITNKKEAK